MGQYFKLVNTDKKEVVNPWDIGGVAKFWEWLYNPQARVLVWLLRQSNEGGGGDIDEPERYTTLGRWAGDRITLIGDYDSSQLWDKSRTKDADGRALPNPEYTDISTTLRQEFNEAVKRDGGGRDYQL
jgi:hypothetical protein